MEAIFINSQNSKINELHTFVFNLSQRLDIRSSNKHASFQKVAYLLHLEKYKTTVQKQ